MSRPWKHPKSSIFWLRKRVPDELRAAIGKTEERRSYRTRDAEVAKVLHAEALVSLEAKWAAARVETATADIDANHATILHPKSLTEREAHEHARWIYSEWLRRHRDYPSKQTLWRTNLIDYLWSYPPYSEGEVSATDLLKVSKMRQKCLDEADLLAVVHDWELQEESRTRLAKALGASLQRASLSLARQAAGENVDPDEPIQATPEAAQQEVPFEVLIRGWAAERRPVAKTIYEWRRAIAQFAMHLGHDDAARATADDVVRWKEALITEGRRPKTIRDAKLVPLRTILQWAVNNRRLQSNPASGVTIGVRQRSGEGPRGFTDDEAKLLLMAATSETNPVLRWVPWICAYTGSRVSEVCQLRTEDVVQIEGFWAIKFDPDAGLFKTRRTERAVPLHPALLASGLVEYTQSLPKGVLFANLAPDKFGKRGGNGTKIIGRWVRSLGLRDKRLKPTHSWRHRIRTLARRYGMPLDLANAISGHASRDEADKYGEYPMEALLRELSKIPPISLKSNEH